MVHGGPRRRGLPAGDPRGSCHFEAYRTSKPRLFALAASRSRVRTHAVHQTSRQTTTFHPRYPEHLLSGRAPRRDCWIARDLTFVRDCRWIVIVVFWFAYGGEKCAEINPGPEDEY